MTARSPEAVGVVGVGWVGLVMPHIARLLVGPNFHRLLPTAMLMGAGYVLLVDTLARTMAETETPLGILTAFVGAPVFLWLLASGRRGWCIDPSAHCSQVQHSACDSPRLGAHGSVDAATTIKFIATGA